MAEAALKAPKPKQEQKVELELDVTRAGKTLLELRDASLGVPGRSLIEKLTLFVVQGDRIGVAWLHRACGACRFCKCGAENLCVAPLFTGWDADGGYAPRVLATTAS